MEGGEGAAWFSCNVVGRQVRFCNGKHSNLRTYTYGYLLREKGGFESVSLDDGSVVLLHASTRSIACDGSQDCLYYASMFVTARLAL